MNELYLSVLTFGTIFSLMAALWHGEVWEKKNPEKLGFRWGYFVIYNSLFNNILLFGFLALSGFFEKEHGFLIFGISGLAGSGALAYYSVLRKRPALIISTVFSFNPIWMAINIFYLRSRWPEFRAESSIEGSSLVFERLRLFPRDVRIALFLAVAWVVCVPSFVYLFEPYGRYMRDDDLTHMIGVIMIPIAVGLGLFFLFRIFVR